MTQPRSSAIDAEDMASLFSRHGLRCTRQRRALYQALVGANSHPTADDLHHAVSEQHKVSLATIYNTLQALCDAGLAVRMAGKGSSARYDAATHNHLHLRDPRTGKVFDLPSDLSQKLLAHLPAEILNQLQQQSGFKLHHVEIELVGEKFAD